VRNASSRIDASSIGTVTGTFAAAGLADGEGLGDVDAAGETATLWFAFWATGWHPEKAATETDNADKKKIVFRAIS